MIYPNSEEEIDLSANDGGVCFWPFLPFNEGLNGIESDFRLVLESGRSECACQGSA